MSATVLSENIVNLVSKLANIQSQKDELQERIQLYENKLNMSRDASLALTNEEQELANQLQGLGFYYGQTPVQEVPIVPGDQSETQDQLATLLSSLLQQQTPTSIQQHQPVPTNPIVPTSGGNSFGGGGIYNFPQPSQPLPPNGIGPVPNGTMPILSAPKTSPTSAPGLSIRRGGNN